MKENIFNENNEKFSDYLEDNYTYLKDNFIQDKDNDCIFREYLLENIYNNEQITDINDIEFIEWYEITLNTTKLEYPIISTSLDSCKIIKTRYESLFTILLDVFISKNEDLFIPWIIEHIN